MSMEQVPKVRLLKAQLFQALENRERDAWKSYWADFQRYLLAQRSLQEFHALALALLGPDQRTYLAMRNVVRFGSMYSWCTAVWGRRSASPQCVCPSAAGKRV